MIMTNMNFVSVSLVNWIMKSTSKQRLLIIIIDEIVLIKKNYR